MSYMKSIGALMSAAAISFTDECDFELAITGLAMDSRDVRPGFLFCAVPGLTVDGRDFIEAAIDNGAVAVLVEGDGYDEPKLDTIPVIKVAGLQSKIGLLADAFFDHPSQDLQVFGVTGTNGKTTCCYLLAQAFTGLGMQAAIMGTLGSGAIHKLSPASHTTPDAISIHQRLAEFRDAGFTQVCMEVSSHALHQARVAGVTFYSTLFTNLSHDHLDYHGDMQSYGEAKQILFTAFDSDLSVVNVDDDLGQQLVDVAVAEFLTTYGVGGDVAASDVSATDDGLSFHIEANGVDFEVKTPLVGLINVPNVLLLSATLLSLSIPVEEIQRLLSNLEPAPGRMQLLTVAGKAKVVVDYAHTPDALDKALRSVSEHCKGSLWCVFGCGGDRDQEKRPLMGKIAASLADHVVITNDNPRTEAPEVIASQIQAGIPGHANIVLDRARAIAEVVSKASADDWVLIAGKGHEETQTIGSETLPFSDQLQVQLALEAAA